MSSNSTRPEKPYKGFPLTPHANGKWQKKILGKIRYFGRWGNIRDGKMVRVPGDGWQTALDEYNAQAADLHAGRPVRKNTTEGLTIKDACNKFLNYKKDLVNSGELTRRTFKDYDDTARLLADLVGSQTMVDYLIDDDFINLRSKIALRFGVHRCGKHVNHIRMIFRFNRRANLLPVNKTFSKPPRKAYKKNRREKGRIDYSATELLRLLDALEGREVKLDRVDQKTGKHVTVKLKAKPQLRAMVLLGINCGFGNSDIATLVKQEFNLANGWVDHPRPKNEEERHNPLWPETVEAVRLAMSVRPDPKDPRHNDLAFLTTFGRPWVRDNADGMSQELGKVLQKLEMVVKGRKVYGLRHTFNTVGLQAADRDAVIALMGHTHSDMVDNYDATGPNEERRLTVSNYVRNWLFAARPKRKPATAKKGGAK